MFSQYLFNLFILRLMHLIFFTEKVNQCGLIFKFDSFVDLLLSKDEPFYFIVNNTIFNPENKLINVENSHFLINLLMLSNSHIHMDRRGRTKPMANCRINMKNSILLIQCY